MQVTVSTDRQWHQPGHYPRSHSTGTLTPELYQEALALYQGKLNGCTNMPAGKSLWQRPRPGCWIIPGTVRKIREVRSRYRRITVFQRRGDTLLTFTFSTSLSLKNSQKTMLLEVIKSFGPTLPPENDIRKGRPALT